MVNRGMKSNSSNNNMVAGKNWTLAVDPNLPRSVCQNCRHSLSITGVDSYPDKFIRSGMHGSSMHGAGSVHGTRMDQSYVVLPKQRNLPPRPNQSGKAMEESFVVLPPPAASVYKSEPTSNNSGFHSTITVLKRACEIATTQTRVEQPLCLECMRVLSDELDKEVEDVNRDIKAYEACLQRLECEPRNVLSEADFSREKLKMEEEERKLEAAIKETEKQCSEVTSELKELEIKSNRFKELEERYWHEFNNFQFQLICHQEKGDEILAKTEVSEAQFELLKKTNVLKEAFPITCVGEFGTINSFRLGRLPKVPITWDEINDAWGQACLLLDTMAQYFMPQFQSRIKILPMGSYPRIMDSSNNNTYKLFGPVNKFWSTQYDKAMTLFLACLKDFAEFANNKDKENNKPQEKCFKLPYKIEIDKVGGYSITQSFNKQENWTKALKYTLNNLKWALYWFDATTTSIED
ncbi:Beclin family [Artemisia annua]|uniref:Beclin family n=1 Tax=Artemisia annua TaxID=35608 RepID=A0A2U1NJD3_ARTAN|nr:Beclin family [Artemisia annua]